MGVKVRDDVVGAALPTAARVVGVSRDRLIAWADRDVLVPSHQHRLGAKQRRVWSYGLDELVLGRIIRVLEDEHNIGIRQIAKIVRAVQSWPGEEPLSRLAWGVSGSEVFVQFDDGVWHGGMEPTQSVAIDMLDLERVRSDTRRRLERPAGTAGQIVKQRGVHGSREVFAGTRVKVETVVSYLDHGYNDAQILSSLPSLFIDDIDAARTSVPA